MPNIWNGTFYITHICCSVLFPKYNYECRTFNYDRVFVFIRILPLILDCLTIQTVAEHGPIFFFFCVTFSNLRTNLVANKCQLCVRTAWPGNKTSIVSNWQNFLPSAVAAANQRPAWWNAARSLWQPLLSISFTLLTPSSVFVRWLKLHAKVKLAVPAAQDDVNPHLTKED